MTYWFCLRNVFLIACAVSIIVIIIVANHEKYQIVNIARRAEIVKLMKASKNITSTGNDTVTKEYVKKRKETNITGFDSCILPSLDIWDDEIIALFDPRFNPEADCKNADPIAELKEGKWNIKNKHKATGSCRARCHWYETDLSNRVGEEIEEGAPVTCEVLETSCSANGENVNYLHTQIIKKEEPRPSIHKRYNVFIILLDSLGYRQAQRSLIRTVSLFKEHFEAVEFPYMNKVGDNSPPNGISLIFGKQLEPINREIMNKETIEPNWFRHDYCSQYLDDKVSIFDDFKNSGYYTLMAEDWAAGILNFPGCLGWRKTPVDHNMRPFQQAYEGYGWFETRSHIKETCRTYHETLLEYYQQFIDAYPGEDEAKFALLWTTTIGHDYFNNFVYTDNQFYDFFVKNKEVFQDSFVLFMGDHGFRGKERSISSNAIDVHNPYIGISIPRELRQTTDMLEIMKENAKHLQTHYDTRATLLDIAKYQPEENFKATSPMDIEGERGNSLIRRQPTFKRSCLSLPIPWDYCICQFHRQPLSTNSTLATLLGKVAELHINTKLQEAYSSMPCSTVQFNKMHSIEVFSVESELYEIVVEMEPNHMQFKTLVYFDQKANEYKIPGWMQRINKYGNTANCILNESLRPYCFCKMFR